MIEAVSNMIFGFLLGAVLWGIDRYKKQDFGRVTRQLMRFWIEYFLIFWLLYGIFGNYQPTARALLVSSTAVAAVSIFNAITKPIEVFEQQPEEE